MSLIVDIPVDLFILLQSFIDIQLLSSLDTSLCNRNKRQSFLTFLAQAGEAKVGIYDGPEGHLVNEHFFGWISLRNITLKSLILNNSMLCKDSFTNSRKCYKHFKKLNYIKCLENAFAKLVSVSFKGCFRWLISVCLSLLKFATELTHISMTDSLAIDQVFLTEISSVCTKIEMFNFQSTALDNDSCKTFCENLAPNQFSFISVTNSNLDKEGIDPAISASFKSLQHLHMSWRTCTPAASVEMFSKCLELITLNVERMSAVQVDAMMIVVEKCHHITDLNIGGCSLLLTDTFIEFLSISRLKLKRLIMHGDFLNTHLKTESLELLFTRKTEICKLDISNLRTTYKILQLIAINLNLNWIRFDRLGILAGESAFNIFCACFERLDLFDTLHNILAGSPIENGSYPIVDNVIFPIKQLLMMRAATLSNVSLSSYVPVLYGAYNLGLMFQDFANLTSLSLSRVIDMSLKSLEPYCRSLQSISLLECTFLTDDVVSSLLKLNKYSITSLTVVSSPLLTNNLLNFLGYNCKSLKYLELLKCDMTLIQMWGTIKRLHYLTELRFDYSEDYSPDLTLNLYQEMVSACDVLSFFDVRKRPVVIDLTDL